MPLKNKMRIASFFAGCGGLDRGFEDAGYDIVFANEYDKSIWDTYRHNHPDTHLDTRSITEIKPEDIGDNIDGMIGGPPCQSWSLAGAMRGIEDARGQLFYDYIRLIEAIQPKFFLAENVKGIISQKHIKSFEGIKGKFREIGYNVYAQLLNAVNYEVPQDRLRVIIVGINNQHFKGDFHFPDVINAFDDECDDFFSDCYKSVLTLRDTIGDLPEPKPALKSNHANRDLEILNHEYMTGSFSPQYMSRNRRREWDDPSFTIQAGGRHAPLHPSSPPMKKISDDQWEFTAPFEEYRRLSVRECARVQTFPDDFEYIYKNVADGYKMIGNAVPVKLAYHLATSIKAYFG